MCLLYYFILFSAIIMIIIIIMVMITMIIMIMIMIIIIIAITSRGNVSCDIRPVYGNSLAICSC